MGVVNDEQLAGALAVQILRRTARMFRLRGGRYAVDPYDHDHGKDGDVAAAGIGVRRVIYNGVAAGYDETDLVWELNLLAGRRIRLRRDEARRLGRYGFGSEARATLDRLSAGFATLPSLLEGVETTSALKVLYALFVTEMLEVEEAPGRIRPGAVLRDTPARPLPVRSQPEPEPEPPPDPPSIVAPRPVAEPRSFVPAAPGAKPETLERFKKKSRPPGGRPLELDPNPDPRAMEAKARFLRGEAYLRKGDHDMALANLRAASQLLPDDADVKAMLALALWRNPSGGDLHSRADQARQKLAEALARSPACARAYRVFGEIYAGLGQIEQAIRCYAKVRDLVPDDIEAAREIKRLERKRSRPGILSLFRKG